MSLNKGKKENLIVIEEEYQKNNELKIHLESEKKLARRDGLTGVRNNNAFKEYTESVDKKIMEKEEGLHFAVVMCDINDLKKINDTSSVGSGQAHENRPPYYALCFIMRVK